MQGVRLKTAGMMLHTNSPFQIPTDLTPGPSPKRLLQICVFLKEVFTIYKSVTYVPERLLPFSPVLTRSGFKLLLQVIDLNKSGF